MSSVLSVRQLNTYVRTLLEGDSNLSCVTVCGEISNFKLHYSSGHLYFSLKDNDAAVRCVMFKSSAMHLKFRPNDGMRVLCRGRVSLYERDGQYQFYADSMQIDGVGDLAAIYEERKERLKKEGLFDTDRRRPLPSFPKTVAVITSDTGAAVQDIINILTRRYPLCKIVLCPVLVQGDGAAPSMINALDRVYKKNIADVIIIGRGGGSAEDLWAFNDEDLARTIARSPIPVISAVGHETDFTICDFVADLRAPTPSAAAELAVPDIDALYTDIQGFVSRAKNALSGRVAIASSRLNKAMQNVYMLRPQMIVESREIAVDKLFARLESGFKTAFDDKEKQLTTLAAKMDSLSPLKVMSRGYTAVTKDDKPVKSVADIETNDILSLKLSDGAVQCRVISKKEENHNG